FVAVSRGESAIGEQCDRLTNKMHGTVGEDKLQAAGVPAAEGVKVGPAVVDVAAKREVLIGGNGAAAQRRVGIGPAAMGVQGRNVSPRQEGIAGAVGHVGGQRDRSSGGIAAGEHAVADIQAIASAATVILIVAPAPTIAGDALVI